MAKKRKLKYILTVEPLLQVLSFIFLLFLQHNRPELPACCKTESLIMHRYEILSNFLIISSMQEGSQFLYLCSLNISRIMEFRRFWRIIIMSEIFCFLFSSAFIKSQKMNIRRCAMILNPQCSFQI